MLLSIWFLFFPSPFHHLIFLLSNRYLVFYLLFNSVGADNRRQFSMEEEDDLLQFAIQQSLIDAGTEKEEVDIWEALKAQRPSRPTTPNLVGEEERQLQR